MWEFGENQERCSTMLSLLQAYNRRVKRAMEKENKKERSSKRSEYIKTIREVRGWDYGQRLLPTASTPILQLVRFVKKRDPRVRQFQMQQVEREKQEQQVKAAQQQQKVG